jgi:hypothetical protein
VVPQVVEMVKATKVIAIVVAQMVEMAKAIKVIAIGI